VTFVIVIETRLVFMEKKFQFSLGFHPRLSSVLEYCAVILVLDLGNFWVVTMLVVSC
jgi:hypothetical protein